MFPSTAIANPLTLKSKARLNFREELYVKLSTAGQDDAFIMNLMRIGQDKINSLRFNVKSKLSANSWLEVISYCFEHNYLSPSDYVYPEIRVLALEYSESLAQKANPSFLHWSQTDKVDIFIQFYKQSQDVLRKHFTKMGIGHNLTPSEKKYLKQRFKAECLESSEEFFDVETSHSRRLKQKLFSKLEAKHWFECYRKALALDILKLGNLLKSSPYSSAARVLLELKEHLNYTPISTPVLQLEIYESLLKFYCTITYQCLFKLSRSTV